MKSTLGKGGVRVIHRSPPPGFGRAVKDGLRSARGDVVVIMMGDLSDDPADVVKLLEGIKQGYDVAYGSRFEVGSRLIGYPPLKLTFNRLFNKVVSALFGMRRKDVTNAFKAYRREVLERIGEPASNDFDLTPELPVKAHLLGFRSIAVPVSWHSRVEGAPKFKLLHAGIVYLRRLLSLLMLAMRLALFGS